MADIIEFNRPEIDVVSCETIFWCGFENSDGTKFRFTLLKNKDTNHIAIGISDGFDHDDDEITIEDVTVLCEDADNFIYNKLMKLLELTI